MKKYRYSEIFLSPQGEGKYSGTPTLWVRSWGCNLTCSGFPCDSEYSWNKDFQEDSHTDTAEVIANKLVSLLPGGRFIKDETFDYHLAFTGGEPLLAQSMIMDVLDCLPNKPKHITIETNGTQTLRPEFVKFFNSLDAELFFSISPKLSNSGEHWDDAVKPYTVKSYWELSREGQLKFVTDNSQESWLEVRKAEQAYRAKEIMFPVWIMPVGETTEQQQQIERDVAEECNKQGYIFCARIHCYVFNNEKGK